jgi:hypothetical protein
MAHLGASDAKEQTAAAPGEKAREQQCLASFLSEKGISLHKGFKEQLKEQHSLSAIGRLCIDEQVAWSPRYTPITAGQMARTG